MANENDTKFDILLEHLKRSRDFDFHGYKRATLLRRVTKRMQMVGISDEELETTNEELQATNEELETINTELSQRTDESNQTNAFLQSILASLQSGAIVVDHQSKLLLWNKRAEDPWGLRPDEVKGKSLYNLDIGLPVKKYPCGLSWPGPGNPRSWNWRR